LTPTPDLAALVAIARCALRSARGRASSSWERAFEGVEALHAGNLARAQYHFVFAALDDLFWRPIVALVESHPDFDASVHDDGCRCNDYDGHRFYAALGFCAHWSAVGWPVVDKEAP